MAANIPYSRSEPASPESVLCLPADGLHARLDEEIGRAERHALSLSCLLIVIENLDGLAEVHGEELREQALAYAADALAHELRRFDRVGRPSDRELAIVLPGADGPRGEIVARRVLERLRSIKVEGDGERRPLLVSVGLSAWRGGTDAAGLLARARAAARRGGEEDAQAAPVPAAPELGRPAGS